MCGFIPISFTDVVSPSRVVRAHTSAHRAAGVSYFVLALVSLAPFTADGWRCGRCKQFIFTCAMLAIVSVGVANLLILQRVVILWEHRPVSPYPPSCCAHTS